MSDETWPSPAQLVSAVTRRLDLYDEKNGAAIDATHTLAAQIDALRAERDALQAKVDAIDALHQPTKERREWDLSPVPIAVCGKCVDGRWPCSTHLILHPEGDTLNGPTPQVPADQDEHRHSVHAAHARPPRRSRSRT